MARTRYNKTSPFFASLVNDNRREIYTYLPLNTLGLFARTSKTSLNDIIKNTTLFKERVLHLAAFAAPVRQKEFEDRWKLAVIDSLRCYPEILFEKGFVKDPAGHVINGSVYKIFLGTRDVWALEIIRKEIIPKIENGEAIANEQYKQQFPYYEDRCLYDDRNFAQFAEIEDDLNEIVAAFTEDSCTEDGKAIKQRTIDAISNIRVHLAPKANEIIRRGLHSPPEIMRMIFLVYNQYSQFGQYSQKKWTNGQNRLYSREVIGAAEAAATAVDAQFYKHGSWNFGSKIFPSYKPERNNSYFKTWGVPADLGVLYFIEIHGGEERHEKKDSWWMLTANSNNHLGLTEYIDHTYQYLIDSCIANIADYTGLAGLYK